MRIFKYLVLAAISTIFGARVSAQDLTINPTPRHISVDSSQTLNILRGFKIEDKQKAFADDVNFLKHNGKGTKTVIDFGDKVADKFDVKNISGAYILRINTDGITIVGRDEQGAFHGLQTLRHILKQQPHDSSVLRFTEINDYPDLPNRGIVEGFYGTPWSHKTRLSVIDFLGEFKMNTYVYGPKDDPYHRSPHWRDPYPTAEAKNIRELIYACKRNRINFVWAIHPGQDIKWTEDDYQNLVGKFDKMYDLGVRHFAIFFDDISGDGTVAGKQIALLNRLSDEFVKAKGDVSPLTLCPTDYTRAWANPTLQGSLPAYGKSLNPDIKIFWTGDVVCGDITGETLDWVDSRIKRPAYVWWNYPVTDYVRHIILQGPVYGLDTSLTADNMCGFLSNPMEHGEASKLALYGVADYTWNVASYKPLENWERGIKHIMPEAYEAYRCFAIHSCDTGKGYRREESWETNTFRLKDWDDSAADSLASEFEHIAEVHATLEEKCTNEALLKELRPWLIEFSKLGVRCKKALELARLFRSGCDENTFWKLYNDNLMSKDEREAYDAHKSGTVKLYPFYKAMMDDLATEMFKRQYKESKQ